MASLNGELSVLELMVNPCQLQGVCSVANPGLLFYHGEGQKVQIQQYCNKCYKYVKLC